MTWSYLNTFKQIDFFSFELVIPMVLHSKILAIWPTAEPTLPAAVVTTTVSPLLGLQISTNPACAVIPFNPVSYTHLTLPTIITV